MRIVHSLVLVHRNSNSWIRNLAKGVNAQAALL
jgi:hypothetical protein